MQIFREEARRPSLESNQDLQFKTVIINAKKKFWSTKVLFFFVIHLRSKHQHGFCWWARGWSLSDHMTFMQQKEVSRKRLEVVWYAAAPSGSPAMQIFICVCKSEAVFPCAPFLYHLTAICDTVTVTVHLGLQRWTDACWEQCLGLCLNTVTCKLHFEVFFQFKDRAFSCCGFAVKYLSFSEK